MSATTIAPACADVRRGTLDEESDTLKMLYHGEPGSGKTTAAAHMAKLGRVVWVLAEPGLKRRPMLDLGIPIENIELHREITYTALNDLCSDLRGALRADPQAYAGVVFDSLTEVQGRLLEAKAKSLLITQQEYGVNTQELTLLLRHFCDLPCHVAFITHPKRDEDSDGEVIYRPSMTPKVSGILLGQVDITCVTMALPRPDSDEPDYVGVFRPHGKHKGKDRFGCLPPRLINPTFDRIAAYVDGTYRREAQREADRSDGVPDGLDAEQYEYRQQAAAAKKVAESKGEAA